MSDEHNWSILRELALIKTGDKSLTDLLKLAKSGIGQNTSLIIITPDIRGKWVESLLAIRQQEVVPTVLVFDLLSFGGNQKVNELVGTLSNYGITYDVIPKELMDRNEIQPGQEGHWEWRVSPLGRAVPVLEPEKLTWRNLS
jgi:hypothetical protein